MNTSAAVMGRSYAGAGATIGPAMTFGFVAAAALGDDHYVLSREGDALVIVLGAYAGADPAAELAATALPEGVARTAVITQLGRRTASSDAQQTQLDQLANVRLILHQEDAPGASGPRRRRGSDQALTPARVATRKALTRPPKPLAWMR